MRVSGIKQSSKQIKSSLSVIITSSSKSILIRKNTFRNNCGHHVAQSLNQMSFSGRSNYSDVTIMAWFAFKGRFVSWYHAGKIYLGVLLFIILMLACITLSMYR